MRILLLIIQILLDYYYIFGYYISGWDHPTENVITENVIHSKNMYKGRIGTKQIVWVVA